MNKSPDCWYRSFQSQIGVALLPALVLSVAMLFAVILNRDFDLLPTHVEVCEDVAELILDRDLGLRSRQAGPY